MDDKVTAKEIWEAIKKGNTATVLALIRGDQTRLQMVTPFGTWLHLAAMYGRLEITKSLVGLGLDVNTTGGIFGGGALNEAASEGNSDIVEYLLSRGAELDVSAPERNPLFSAIYGGHINVVRFLLASGIDARVRYDSPSMSNMDALAFAIERGQSEIAALLRNRAGDPSKSRN